MTSLRTFLDLIKFEHTIFALPFAYLGMVLEARFVTSYVIVRLVANNGSVRGTPRVFDMAGYVMRVDFAWPDHLTALHVNEAINYRVLDRNLWT